MSVPYLLLLQFYTFFVNGGKLKPNMCEKDYKFITTQTQEEEKIGEPPKNEIWDIGSTGSTLPTYNSANVQNFYSESSS